MNVIEITESNYQDFATLDIVAFSFAYEGAMGEMGGIYIIDLIEVGRFIMPTISWGMIVSIETTLRMSFLYL